MSSSTVSGGGTDSETASQGVALIESERTGELQVPAPQAYYPPIELMSQAAIDRELGARLREIARLQAQEDEEFLMLMAMIL